MKAPGDRSKVSLGFAVELLLAPLLLANESVCNVFVVSADKVPCLNFSSY